ncbi:MAG: spondin domain-containing protein [Gammaproteobacteria bacterium]|nr:spondin domain-containing protein [Gammaproteobacteria bacterium]
MTKQALLAGLVLATLAGAVNAGDKFYDVTITNMTRGQSFTPIAVVTHTDEISLFTPGAPAIAEIVDVAESGNVAPLASLAASLPELVGPVATSEGLLGPGETTTIRVGREGRFDQISFVAMLIPTNDTFVAINTVAAPKGKDVLRLNAIAYDAGSEVNDENCANIPGPVCGGVGLADDDGEGYVHVSGGIKGIDSLDPVDYDWRNPVASVTIVRAKGSDDGDDGDNDDKD